MKVVNDVFLIVLFSSLNRKRLLEKKSGRKMLSESTLSLLAKRVELDLFESAYSLEDYSDLSTLKKRLIAIARKALLDSH